MRKLSNQMSNHSITVKNKLKQADKLKDQFLANTSHELRTPLNGIIGLAESLIDGIGGKQSPVGVKNLRMIATSGTRLASLINDILDFSKLKNNKIDLRLVPLHLKSNTDIVLMLSKPLIKKKEIELINNIPETMPFIEADENRLQQIMLNILGNAIKFTEKGQITVDSIISIEKEGKSSIIGTKSIKGNYAIISVKDSGIGIAKHLHEKIFETFQQGDGSTDRTYGGTGIGLSVTKQLVDLHGGEVWVDSEVGKGSTFFFSIPIDVAKIDENFENYNDNTIKNQEITKLEVNESLLETPSEKSSENQTATIVSPGVDASETYNILVVDDEVVNLQVLENQLSLKNFNSTLAENGKEALKIINNGNKFDLILLDIMMPQMSGYEVCEAIRKDYQAEQLPIIMLTAKNQVNDLVTAFESGANDYLTKPFSKNELFARIDSHLQLKTANVKLDDYSKTLEIKVEERTAEIQEKNVVLGQQKEEIQVQNEDLQQRNEEIQSQNEEISLQAEKLAEVNKELEKLSIVASETDNAIVIMNKEAEFEWINAGFTKLYGYNFEEFKEKHKNLFSVSSNPEIKETIDNCIKNKRTYIYESVSETKKGEKLWVQTTLTPILDYQGEISKLIAIESDIRKLKKIEKELALKNEHITSSIEYAKTIQTAILPFKEVISSHFDNFILFKPKDIVSGDFYWFVETEEYRFIAAADCTGHGVPGAFMSMIGSSLLNQIVHHDMEYNTANILTRLHELVVSSLRQQKTDNNDGMDICLCRIQKKNETSIVQFTGAKRPLIYTKSGSPKAEILRSDRKSIGGTQQKRIEVQFTTQEIELAQGSSLYLSSDGFVDQNNKARKKFGSQKLIDLIESNSNSSLIDQHKVLDNEIESWMEGTDQRDDITLLGIKV